MLLNLSVPGTRLQSLRCLSCQLLIAMTYSSGKISRMDSLFRTITMMIWRMTRDRLFSELPVTELTTVRHQGVCEIGCRVDV